MTWRLLAALVVLVAAVAGAFAILHWYAYSTYYLANDEGVVAVYQGQPHGVFWYQPVLATTTPYLVKDLRPLDARSLAATISEPSVAAAEAYAKSLHDQWLLGRTTTTTTTIAGTTTSAPTTTTTQKKG